MDTRGRHLLVEYAGCAFESLNDLDRIKELMETAAIAAQTNILHSHFHHFTPQGVSGVVIVEESHLSIHTWPEIGYAAVDFYTCGVGHPNAAHEVLQVGLRAKQFEMMYVERGLNPHKSHNLTSMQLRGQHFSEHGASPLFVLS